MQREIITGRVIGAKLQTSIRASLFDDPHARVVKTTKFRQFDQLHGRCTAD